MQGNNDEIRRRLDRLIRDAGESYAAISKRIGRNPAYVQQFIRRGVPRRLAEQDRIHLASYFRISEQELGGPPPGSIRTTAPTQASRVTVQPLSGCHEVTEPQSISVLVIPMIDRPPGNPSDDRCSASGFVLQADIANRISGDRPEDLGAMMADGDSMAPTIVHGDYLLFDTAQRTADRSGLYVLPGTRVPMVRRIALDPLDGTASIIADNPHYPDRTGCDPRAITIVGRIIWTGKPMN